jgi:hypothetical protein
MTTREYNQLDTGPIDEIDSAIWSGDLFHSRENIQSFRNMMARWERGLREAESILDETEADGSKLDIQV